MTSEDLLEILPLKNSQQTDIDHQRKIGKTGKQKGSPEKSTRKKRLPAHFKRLKKFLIYLLLTLGGLLIALAALFWWSRSRQNALFLTPLYRLPTHEKTAALTFDDGPSLTRTPGLLELLDKYKIKATFFMTGANIVKHRSIAREVVNQGHLLGNHGFSHKRLYLKSPYDINTEIYKTDNLIKSLGQEQVSFLRPPYSAKFILLPMMLAIKGKTLVTGSLDPPAQYQEPENPRLITGEILSRIRPGDIIFLHDGKEQNRESFLTAVELIIQGLLKKGYNLIRLDNLH